MKLIVIRSDNVIHEANCELFKVLTVG